MRPALKAGKMDVATAMAGEMGLAMVIPPALATTPATGTDRGTASLPVLATGRGTVTAEAMGRGTHRAMAVAMVEVMVETEATATVADEATGKPGK